MSSDMYKIDGVGHRQYARGREAALKICRRMNAIPDGRPLAGTYRIELVTSEKELAHARRILREPQQATR